MNTSSPQLNAIQRERRELLSEIATEAQKAHPKPDCLKILGSLLALQTDLEPKPLRHRIVRHCALLAAQIEARESGEFLADEARVVGILAGACAELREALR